MSAGTDRLERSRLAILEHIHRKEERRHQASRADDQPSVGERMDRARAAGGGGAWFEQARDALESWWRYHPAHVALDVARPALAAYARRKPGQYVGIAAAAGAALLLLRPWRLVSVTGVLFALLKSPQLAGLVLSALSSSQNPRDDHAPPDR